jgi:hypothetical protein
MCFCASLGGESNAAGEMNVSLDRDFLTPKRTSTIARSNENSG